MTQFERGAFLSEAQRRDVISALEFGADLRSKTVQACQDCAEDKPCELHVADAEQVFRWEKLLAALRKPGDQP